MSTSIGNDESIQEMIKRVKLLNNEAYVTLRRTMEESEDYNGRKYTDNHYGPSVDQLR